MEYLGLSKQIIVTCKIHGDFSTNASNHKYGGGGCMKCAIKSRTEKQTKTFEDFVKEAEIVHGNKYSYTEQGYENRVSKVYINCAEHGEFLQTVNDHIRGAGCPSCRSKMMVKPFKEFLENAKAVHGDTYKYDEQSYIAYAEKVNIKCEKHGAFSQNASQHVRGHGCRKCHFDKKRKDTEYFKQLSKNVHGDKYDYSVSKYIGVMHKVSIICKEHGVFEQTPAAHYSGQGCSSCAVSGFKKDIPGLLYVLTNGNLTKIGITNRDVYKRVSDINVKKESKFDIQQTFNFDSGRDAQELELFLLRSLKSSHTQPNEKFDGSTECFINLDKIHLDSLIYDWIMQ